MSQCLRLRVDRDARSDQIRAIDIADDRGVGSPGEPRTKIGLRIVWLRRATKRLIRQTTFVKTRPT